MRMVNRSDGVVSTVLVNGRVAFENGACTAALGRDTGFGHQHRVNVAPIQRQPPDLRRVDDLGDRGLERGLCSLG